MISTSRSHRFPAATIAVALLLAAAAPLAGQQTDAGRRIFDEQLRVQLDRQLPEGRELGLDGGGWFTFALFKFDDASAPRFRTLRQYELRGWGRLNLQGVHELYFRGLLSRNDWNSGDNTDQPHEDENFQRVERAWYRFDLGQLIRNRTGQAAPVEMRFKVGRDYAQIGSAMVLSLPLDLVQFDVRYEDWELMAFLGMTIRDRGNIDDSDAVNEDQQRGLWGIEIAYDGFDRHRPYAYFMANYDRTTPDPRSTTQRYDYTSRYVGVGSEGSVLGPNMRYQAELVGEFGRTFSNGVTNRQDDICAVAADLLLEYYFQTPTHPKVMFEYLFGSGDKDRTTSATATAGGNEAGTNDNAFNAFGFRDTGIAFAPEMANLHMFILGGSLFPLEQHALFEKMEVGTKVFFYNKATDGAISDTTATKRSRWVGWEWDIFCDWRITSDLTFTVRYGVFMPGAVFDDKTCRQFLYTAVTYSF